MLLCTNAFMHGVLFKERSCCALLAHTCMPFMHTTARYFIWFGGLGWRPSSVLLSGSDLLAWFQGLPPGTRPHSRHMHVVLCLMGLHHVLWLMQQCCCSAVLACVLVYLEGIGSTIRLHMKAVCHLQHTLAPGSCLTLPRSPKRFC